MRTLREKKPKDKIINDAYQNAKIKKRSLAPIPRPSINIKFPLKEIITSQIITRSKAKLFNMFKDNVEVKQIPFLTSNYRNRSIKNAKKCKNVQEMHDVSYINDASNLVARKEEFNEDTNKHNRTNITDSNSNRSEQDLHNYQTIPIKINNFESNPVNMEEKELITASYTSEERALTIFDTENQRIDNVQNSILGEISTNNNDYCAINNPLPVTAEVQSVNFTNQPACIADVAMNENISQMNSLGINSSNVVKDVPWKKELLCKSQKGIMLSTENTGLASFQKNSVEKNINYKDNVINNPSLTVSSIEQCINPTNQPDEINIANIAINETIPEANSFGSNISGYVNNELWKKEQLHKLQEGIVKMERQKLDTLKNMFSTLYKNLFHKNRTEN